MSANPARDRFAALVGRRGEDLDLLEAALLVAAEEHPQTSVEDHLARIGVWAARLARLVSPGAGDHNILYAANRLLYGELGFARPADPLQPEAVLLDRVMQRRRGQPAAVALLHREVVARALGLELVGVDFPLGFLLAVPGEEGFLYLDPGRGGKVLLREEVLVRQSPDEAPVPGGRDPLPTLTSRQWLAALLLRLKAAHARRRDVGRTLAAVERLVLVDPASAEQRRDRGILYGLAGRARDAIADLEDYLTMRPEAEDAEQVRRRLERLHRRGTA